MPEIKGTFRIMLGDQLVRVVDGYPPFTIENAVAEGVESALANRRESYQ